MIYERLRKYRNVMMPASGPNNRYILLSLRTLYGVTRRHHNIYIYIYTLVCIRYSFYLLYVYIYQSIYRSLYIYVYIYIYICSDSINSNQSFGINLNPSIASFTCACSLAVFCCRVDDGEFVV